MSVLDLDFYKLTMLQFIWKHYADIPVTFRLHSRKQQLSEIVNADVVAESIFDYYYNDGLSYEEYWYLESLGVFSRSFLDDLTLMLRYNLARPRVSEDGTIEVKGTWFQVSLWETVILSMVTEQHSREILNFPSLIRHFSDIDKVSKSGANWADFGTRRRFSYEFQRSMVQIASNEDVGFLGTSNVDIARQLDVKPVGTYAHELEMVLRPYHATEFNTTREVLTKWQNMYPRELRIALTDTYTTDKFLADHGGFLLDNDWRGVRLDSGLPSDVADTVKDFLYGRDTRWDVVFSDGLDAKAIASLHGRYIPSLYINPVFGWGTGFTNPNSDLSLVMKAVESNGVKTYKITDDSEKSIR